MRADGRRSSATRRVFPVRDARGELAGLGRRRARRHRPARVRGRAHAAAARRAAARAAAEAAQVRAEARRPRPRPRAARTDFLARAGERLAVLTRDYERTLQEVARVAVPDDGRLVHVRAARARAASRAPSRSPRAIPSRTALAVRARRALPVADLDAPTGTGARAAHRRAAAHRARSPTRCSTDATADPRGAARSCASWSCARARRPAAARATARSARSASSTPSRAARYERGRPARSRGRSPCAPRSRSRTRGCTPSARTSPRPCSARCCRPRCPDVPGLELAARYRAAGDAERGRRRLLRRRSARTTTATGRCSSATSRARAPRPRRSRR